MNEISTSIAFNDEDIIKLKCVYPLITSNLDLKKLVIDKVMVKVGDVDNLIDLHNEFIGEHGSCLTLNEYIDEIKLGYGESKYLDIARLIVLSNGIWYDNEYC